MRRDSGLPGKSLAQLRALCSSRGLCYDRNQTRGQLMMTLQASTQTEDALAGTDVCTFGKHRLRTYAAIKLDTKYCAWVTMMEADGHEALGLPKECSVGMRRLARYLRDGSTSPRPAAPGHQTAACPQELRRERRQDRGEIAIEQEPPCESPPGGTAAPPNGWRKLTWGTHKGRTYMEVVQNYPGYADWALKTVAEEAEVGDLRAFARFVRVARDTPKDIASGSSSWAAG